MRILQNQNHHSETVFSWDKVQRLSQVVLHFGEVVLVFGVRNLLRDLGHQSALLDRVVVIPG